MKSQFSFEKLIKKFPNVKIPKEIIGFGIGMLLIILLGLIASNMYLQEMLFFEGVEKSVPFFTEEELREYGELYKELSRNFQSKIGVYCQDFANRTNRAGEKIHYGIYNHEHPDGNSSKIHPHTNGSNVNKADDPRNPDNDDSYNNFNVEWSYLDTDEYKNGVTIRYAKTNGKSDGQDNFQDILTIVSILLDQKQTDDTFNVENGTSIDKKDLKEKVPNLIKTLFNMSHTFTGTTTDLYPCEMGCRVLFYYCNEVDNEYKSTGIDLQPFPINPHDKLLDYGYDYDEECFELVDPVDECPLCGHNGKGCIEDSALCLHGSSKTCGGEDCDWECKHSIGESPGGEGCDNYQENAHCSHHNCECEDECPHDGETGIGCAGCYECKGHKHYDCEGHFYVCCMGHTDLTLKIKIMYLEEMLDVIKNGYNPDM